MRGREYGGDQDHLLYHIIRRSEIRFHKNKKTIVALGINFLSETTGL